MAYTYHRIGFDVLDLAGDKLARRSLHPVIKKKKYRDYVGQQSNELC